METRHPFLFVVSLLIRKRFFVVVLGRFSSFPGLLDLATYEFGKIVEGLFNRGRRDVLVLRGLQASFAQVFGLRLIAVRGKRSVSSIFSETQVSTNSRALELMYDLLLCLPASVA